MGILEISKQFPTELEAIQFFETTRWGNVKCAYCGSGNLSKRTRDLRHKCYDCNKTSSVTIGTSLQNTNMDLKKWLYAFSITSDTNNRLSPVQLQRNLNISYPTARKMCRKIRSILITKNNKTPVDANAEWSMVGQHYHIDLQNLEKYIAGQNVKFKESNDDNMFEKLVVNSMMNA